MANPSMTPTMQIAQWTAFLKKSTPRAQAIMNTATQPKRIASPVDAISGQFMRIMTDVPPRRRDVQ